MNIFKACMEGAIEVVRSYVDNGGDVNVVNEYGDGHLHLAAYGDSPLHLAACCGRSLGVCECLVENGADVNLVNKYGVSVFNFVDKEIVEGWLTRPLLII